MKKHKTVYKFAVIGVCAVMAISSILMTVVTTTSGAEISMLQKEKAKLLDDKRNLESSLVKSLSLNQLELKSRDLEFVKPENLVYVAPIEMVAKLP